MTLQEFIKATRKEKGISLVDLAEKTGISYTALYNLEEGEGKKNPHPDNLRKIAPHLGVDYDTLMDLAGYLPKASVHDPLAIQIPILSFSSIKKLLPINSELSHELSAKTLTVNKAQKGRFATTITTTKWMPIFSPDDTLLIDPLSAVEEDDIVAYLGPQDQLSFMRLISIQKTPYLCPLFLGGDQAPFPLSKLKKNQKIGVVKQLLRSY